MVQTAYKTFPKQLLSKLHAAEGRKYLMANHLGNWKGHNEDDEEFFAEIREDGISVKLHQDNFWIRLYNYNAEGELIKETLDGKWKWN